jgi:hypothetical protein
MLKYLSEIRQWFLSHPIHSLLTALRQISRVPTTFLEAIYKKMSYAILGPKVISVQFMNHWRKCILQLWLVQFISSQIRYVTKATRWICLKFCCYGKTANIQKINSVFNKMCLMNVSAMFRINNGINIMRIAYQFKVMLSLRNISDTHLHVI